MPKSSWNDVATAGIVGTGEGMLGGIERFANGISGGRYGKILDTNFDNSYTNRQNELQKNADHAGYAENWNDFATNLAVNGIANTAGLTFDAIPILRTLGSNTGKNLLNSGKKFIKQGINSFADKLKNMYYKENEGEERYY